MGNSKWDIVLSTTEPYNHVGLLKVRQNNTDSEIITVQIIENNIPKNLENLKIMFCTTFVTGHINKVIERNAEIIEEKKGIVKYTIKEDDMLTPGRQIGYFELWDFGKMLATTQNFEYTIQESALKKVINAESYLQRAEDVFDLLGEAPAFNLSQSVQRLENNKVGKQELRNVTANLESDLRSKRDKNVLLKMGDLAQDVKEAMSGGSVAVVGPNSVGRINVIDSTLTRDKLNWYSENLSDNLFDKTLVQQGGNYNSGSGKWVTNPAHAAVKINASAAEKFYSSSKSTHHWAAYDGNDIFISGGLATTFTTPANTKYMQVSFNLDIIDNLQIKRGDKPSVITMSTPKYNDEYLSLGTHNFSDVIDSLSLSTATIINTTNPSITAVYDPNDFTIRLKKGYRWFVFSDNTYYAITSPEDSEDFIINLNGIAGNNTYIFYSIADNTFIPRDSSYFKNRKINTDEVYLGYLNTKYSYSNSAIFQSKDIMLKEKVGTLALGAYNSKQSFVIDYDNKKLTIFDAFNTIYVAGRYIRLESKNYDVAFAEDSGGTTHQYLYYSIDSKDFIFKTAKETNLELTNSDTIFLGNIHTVYQINNLHIISNQRAALGSARILNNHDSSIYQIDYDKMTLTFPAQTATNWKIMADNGPLSYLNVNKTEGDVVLSLHAAFNYLFVRRGVTPAEFYIATTTDFSQKDFSDYYYLGFINANTKKDYLNFAADNESKQRASDINNDNAVVIFGDSLSTFKNDEYCQESHRMYYPKGDLTDSMLTWWKPLLKKYAKYAKNYAYSGGRLTNVHAEYPSTIDIINDSTMDVEPNIIINFIGTNDYTSAATLELFEQTYNEMITLQRAKYPLATIYCASLPFNVRYLTGLTNSKGNKIMDYNKIIAKVCDERNVVYVPLHQVGIGAENYSHFFVDEGVHYNVIGAKIIRNNFEKAIKEFR